MRTVAHVTEMTAIKANYNPSVGEVVERVLNNTIVFDNISQRGEIWDIARKSCLIRTVLRNGSLGLISARDELRDEIRVLSVVEGQQRCRALTEYLQNEFALELEDFNCIFCYKGKEVELEGKYYKDLPQVMQEKIRNYVVSIEYRTNLSDADANEMFYFSNNGKPIASDQQMWAMTISKPQIELLGKGAAIFKRIMSPKLYANYGYRVLLMRSLYLLHYERGTGLEKKTLMPFLMDYDLQPDEMTLIKQTLSLMDDVYTSISGKISSKTISKKTLTKFCNKTHFIMLFYHFVRAVKEKRTKEEMTEWVIHFFGVKSAVSVSPDYNLTMTSVLKAHNVEKRMAGMTADYEEFFQKT